VDGQWSYYHGLIGLKATKAGLRHRPVRNLFSLIYDVDTQRLRSIEIHVIDFRTEGDTRRLLFESLFLHITQLNHMSSNFSLHEFKENGINFLHMEWLISSNPSIKTVTFPQYFSSCLSRLLLMSVYFDSGNTALERNSTRE